MDWMTLSEDLTLSTIWQFTELNDANFYRITSLSNPVNTNRAEVFGRYEIGQFDSSGNAFNLKAARHENFPAIFSIPKPQFFNEQRLGIRIAPNSFPFRVKIEGLIMPISSIDPTSSSMATTLIAAPVADAVILAANPDRLGMIIRNTTTKALFIDFDAAVTLTDYAVQIAVGASYEPPCRFVGAVRGICAAGTTGNIIIKEFTV
jgi:hypothetical protein